MPPARFSKTFFVGLESLCAHRFSGHALTASAIRSAAFPFHFLKPRVSRAAEQPDLAAHVAALQEQIVTLKALVEQQKGNELQESGLPPYCGCPPWATHLSFPWDMRYRAGVRPHSFALRAAYGRLSGQRPLARIQVSGLQSQVCLLHSPLHHAVVAQRGGGSATIYT